MWQEVNAAMRSTLTTRWIHVNDVELAVHEWSGSGPPIFFAHATGFHGRCWDAIVAELPQRCLAVDVRGHGRSDAPPPPYAWSTLGADIAALVQALGLRGCVGVGHSMGGHLIVQAAAAVPEAFAALLLVEPVIFPQAIYGQQWPGEHFAARRRDRWQSPQEMIERFAARPPFSHWQPQVLHDYCTHALRPMPDGDGYVLACSPAVEAALYTAGLHPDADIYGLLDSIQMPVQVMRAGQPQHAEIFDMQASPTAPDLANHFLQGEDEYLPAYTHFLPMEDPLLVATRIGALAERIGKQDGE